MVCDWPGPRGGEGAGGRGMGHLPLDDRQEVALQLRKQPDDLHAAAAHQSPAKKSGEGVASVSRSHLGATVHVPPINHQQQHQKAAAAL